MSVLTHEQIEDLLENVLGCEKLGQWKSDKISCCCPIHGENHPSFGVNANYAPEGEVIQAFSCFACGAHGSLPKLLVMAEPERFKNVFVAMKFLEKRYGVDYSEKVRSSGKASSVIRYEDLGEEEERREEKSKFLMAQYKCGKQTYKSFFRGEMTKDEMREYKVGRDLDTKSVAIPVFYADGVLAGFQKKRVNSERHGNRFLYDFKKSSLIYPLDKVEVVDTLIGVESMTDVMLMRKWGIKNVVSFFGAKVSRAQADLIVDMCEKFIPLFDGDEMGRLAEERVMKMLKGRVRVCTCEYPDISKGKDPEEWGEKLTKKILKSAGRAKISRVV